MVQFRWRVALSILISLGVTGVLQARPDPQAETEANGTAATADTLNLRGGYGIGSGTITAGDLDFWTFTAPADSRVWLVTDTGGVQGGGATSRDTVVDLLGPDGTTVIENDDDDGIGNGGDGTIEIALASTIAGRTLTDGGTYFIRVRAFSGTGVINPYRLLVAVTNVTATAEVEPNEAFGTANQVAVSPVGVRSGSIGAAADVDYFSVSATAGDTVFIATDADPERDGTGTDLVVEFRSPADALLLSIDSSITGSLANPAAETGNYLVPASGTYFLKVRHFSATGTGSYHLMVAARPASETLADFDGDRKTDIGVYRGFTGDWFVVRSVNNTLFPATWGCAACADISVPGDYDGDGKADVAVYRNTSGEWIVANSAGGTLVVGWGAPAAGDIAMPGDYDGDGKTDLAVYRNTSGEWIVANSTGGTLVVGWGAPALGDIAVPSDYDGDGKADVAVYRNTTGAWYVRNSAGGSSAVGWGAPALGDIPVPSDYDGDGKADIAIYRNSSGEWIIRNSAGGTTSIGWGSPAFGDIPVPGDYDGDGMADIAVYRTSTGEWFVRRSGGGTTHFGWGGAGDSALSRPSALR